ncbi:MAG: hypothetical protein HQ559_08520 [Lentisphaerae bacterium]|nr:hypothetical protein [Lentisphaerota bacterium]
MNVFIIVLSVVGSLTCMVGAGMIIIAAFRESVGWGIGVLLFQPAAFIFVLLHWDEAKKGFLVQLAGVCVFVAAWGMVFAQGKQALDDAFETFSLEQIAGGMQTGSSGGDGDGIDPDGEETADTENEYVGMSVKDVVKLLGRPEGSGQSGDTVILVYREFELVSTDGVTVTSQAVPAQ